MDYILINFKNILYNYNLPTELRSKIILQTKSLEICIELGFYFEAKLLIRDCNFDENIILNACKQDKLKILKFFYLIGYNYSYIHTDLVIKNGHLEILEFFHSINVNYSENAIALATQKGHLKILKYLHSIKISTLIHKIYVIECGHGQLNLVLGMNNKYVMSHINKKHLKCIKYLSMILNIECNTFSEKVIKNYE